MEYKVSVIVFKGLNVVFTSALLIGVVNFELLKTKLIVAILIITLTIKIFLWIKDYELKTIEIKSKKKEIELMESELKSYESFKKHIEKFEGNENS